MSGVKAGMCSGGVKGSEQIERAAGGAHMLRGDAQKMRCLTTTAALKRGGADAVPLRGIETRFLAANHATRKAQPTVGNVPRSREGLKNHCAASRKVQVEVD